MENGPVILDLEGLTLSQEERELLQHPAVGGVILFTRNHESTDQLKQLIHEISAIREDLLIGVDQEGGRVQRFRDGFTLLPAARHFGELYDTDPMQAQCALEQVAYTMATELSVLGIDICFAPVLDIDRGISSVIGDRSFHHEPEVVSALGIAFFQGLRRGGISAIGKHFPGHGGVSGDTHLEAPIDDRPYQAIQSEDLWVFQELIAHGLPGIMPSHVSYTSVDDKPAVYSHVWLNDVLRDTCLFQGVVISDALDMVGAGAAGGFAERACVALEAGCDMALVCNNRQGAIEIVEGLEGYQSAQLHERLLALKARRS